jgi:hypothetical protein
MAVSFSDLRLAFEFVSSGGMGQNEAYLDRQSGKIYWHSEFGDNDEELPNDIDDEKYISIPNAAVVTVTQEAIRVCGGRAFLRRYPLERYARDARAAALMRPWTQEIAMQQAWEAAVGLDGQRGAAGGA